MNICLLIGALLGLTSVMLAAFTDHSLAMHLSVNSIKMIATALKYQQRYAVVISMLGLMIPLQSSTSMKLWLTRSAYLFVAGVILFCSGIYVAEILSIPHLLKLTPIGGVMLMVAWISLMRTALLKVN